MTAASRPTHDVRLLHDRRVPMRDGISLSADVYLPLGGQGLPTIVQWTPYESTRERFVSWGVWFAQRGYAAVVVDVRGRYESEGEFTAWTLRRPGRVRHASPGRPTSSGRTAASAPGAAATAASSSGSSRTSRHPNLAVHRAAGDPRRLLLGRLLDGRRLPARAHARGGGALDERDGADHRARAPRDVVLNDRIFGHLPLIELDEVTIGRKVDYWRLWWEHQDERRLLAAVPPPAGEGQRADLPAGRLVRPVLRLAPALVRRDRRPRAEPRADRAVVARGGGRARSPATSTSRRR